MPDVIRAEPPPVSERRPLFMRNAGTRPFSTLTRNEHPACTQGRDRLCALLFFPARSIVRSIDSTSVDTREQSQKCYYIGPRYYSQSIFGRSLSFFAHCMHSRWPQMLSAAPDTKLSIWDHGCCTLKKRRQWWAGASRVDFAGWTAYLP